MAAGSVTLINVDSGATSVIKLGNGSEGQRVIDEQVWVGNGMDGSISIVDAQSAAEVDRIDAVCRFPIALDHDKANRVWVACFASSELLAIDRESREVTQRIPLDDQPLNLLLHPSRALAYVSYPRQNAVAEIDLTTSTEIRRIRVGMEPDGLRWAQ